MKKFNKEIQIRVEVDQIAEQLLSTFPDDYKHREILTETIIGNLLQTNEGVTQLYNSLNGHSNDINFKEGDIIISSRDVTYDCKSGKNTILRVKEVNPYATSKLYVEYYNDAGKLRETWINHRYCTITFEEFVAPEPKILGKIDLEK